MIWLVSALALLFTAAFVILLCRYRAQQRRVRQLTEAMEDYLSGRRKSLSFSTQDDAFSALENAAAELQYAHSLEQEKSRRVIREEADFIADVSHQFKTPLSALRLFTEMEEGVYSSRQIELLDRMEHLIYALLRLEKFRSGAYEMEFADRDLTLLVREVSRDIALLYPCVRIRIQGEALLRCDEKFLWEALGNVIKNAAQHAKSEVVIDLQACERSVLMTVEDDGGGIEEEKLGQIFRRFTPAAGIDPQSHGLGLAIARAIVEKHHGTIEAENGTKGLRITICFPVIEGKRAIAHLSES